MTIETINDVNDKANSTLKLPSQMVAILFEMIIKAYQKEGALSQEEYHRILELNNDMSRLGSEQDKKDYCALLFWARTNVKEGTSAYGVFGTLEKNFRLLCQPMLNKINSFWPSCHPMPDDYVAEPSFTLSSAPRNRL